MDTVLRVSDRFEKAGMGMMDAVSSTPDPEVLEKKKARYFTARYKTLKYCPDFPERFGSIEDAGIFCRHFFDWYNRKHRHSGIGFLTPEQVHYGLTDKIISRREAVLMAAFNENSRRFRGRVPHVARPPARVWINPPSDIAETPAPEGSGQGCPDFSDTQSWMTDAIASHHKSCAALH